jgi:hypothetical protein
LLELVALVRHPPNDDDVARPQVPGVKVVYFNVGGLLVPVVLALAATAGPGCGHGKPVLAVSYRVQNDVDTGVAGNAWAFDMYSRGVRVWRKPHGRFCSVSTYDGEFTSIAGTSPGGKWQLPAGIRGTFSGTSVTTFRAKLSPRAGAPLRGFLGTKDFACTSADVKGRCTGTWDWINDYFANVSGFRYARYAFRYHATQNGNGTFSDSLAGGKVRYTGDIRAARPKPRR